MMVGCFVDLRCALLGCSLFAHIDPPRTLYGRQSRCLGSLVAIQQRAHKEIVINHFEPAGFKLVHKMNI